MYDTVMEKYGFIPFDHKMPKEDFNPSLESIHDARGRVIPGHKAVMRCDTGDVLAVHSDKYALVPYRQHFEHFEKAIERSQLNTEGMRVGTDYQDNGAKIYRQYLFPAHTKVINNNGGERPIALRLYMFDSYDGSTAFQGACGFFDFVCANASIFGEEVDRIRFRHVGDLETKVYDAAERLTGAAERFVQQMERLAKWPRIDLRTAEFSHLVDELPQGNQRLTDALTAEYARNSGSNLWDAHQLLTAWSTHNINAKTQADRQKRVAMLVQDELWRGLEREHVEF